MACVLVRGMVGVGQRLWAAGLPCSKERGHDPTVNRLLLGLLCVAAVPAYCVWMYRLVSR